MNSTNPEQILKRTFGLRIEQIFKLIAIPAPFNFKDIENLKIGSIDNYCRCLIQEFDIDFRNRFIVQYELMNSFRL